MFHSRLISMLVGFALLAVVIVGIGHLLSSRAGTAEAAAPGCGAFTINAAGLSASEVYYARQAEQLIGHGACSALTDSEVPMGQPFCTQPTLSLEWAYRALSPSEAYYAQKAERFTSCQATGGTRLD